MHIDWLDVLQIEVAFELDLDEPVDGSNKMEAQLD